MPKLKQRQQNNRGCENERKKHQRICDALKDGGVWVERFGVGGVEGVVEEGGVAGGEEGDEEVGEGEGEDCSKRGEEGSLVRCGRAVVSQYLSVTVLSVPVPSREWKFPFFLLISPRLDLPSYPFRRARRKTYGSIAALPTKYLTYLRSFVAS
jgi:hypothetical protein